MAYTDEFSGRTYDLDDPATRLIAVTPHDSNELSNLPKALYVGVTGDVSVIAVNDSVAVVFKAVPAGSILPVRARIVKSTGTTATDIVGMV